MRLTTQTFLMTLLLALMSCSGESTSGGLTIADRIEAAGAEAAAATISGTWADDPGAATVNATGDVTVSDSMEVTFSWDTENTFNITAIEFEGAPAVTLNSSAGGVADYDYITDTMTIYASGIIDDSTDTMSFFMTIELTGVALNTLSQANMFDLTDYEPVTVTVEFQGGLFSIVYDDFNVGTIM